MNCPGREASAFFRILFLASVVVFQSGAASIKASDADFAPEIVHPRVRVLGKGKMPRPQKMLLNMVETGSEDSQWVEASGIVHSVNLEEDGGRVTLHLVSNEGRFTAQIP